MFNSPIYVHVGGEPKEKIFGGRPGEKIGRDSCFDLFVFPFYYFSHFSFFSDLGIELNPTRNHFLFGDPDHLAYSLKNFIFLILKKYIWREKFRVATLSLVGYKTMLKKYIYDLVYMLKYREIPDKVNEWNEMLDHL